MVCIHDLSDYSDKKVNITVNMGIRWSDWDFILEARSCWELL